MSENVTNEGIGMAEGAPEIVPDVPTRPVRIGVPWGVTIAGALLGVGIGACVGIMCDRAFLYNIGPNPWPVPDPVVKIVEKPVPVEPVVQDSVPEPEPELEPAPAVDEVAEGEIDANAFEPVFDETFSATDHHSEMRSDEKRLTVRYRREEIPDVVKAVDDWFQARLGDENVICDQRDINGSHWFAIVNKVDDHQDGMCVYRRVSTDGRFQDTIEVESYDNDFNNPEIQLFSETVRHVLESV